MWPRGLKLRIKSCCANVAANESYCSPASFNPSHNNDTLSSNSLVQSQSTVTMVPKEPGNPQND
eukprot:5908599-Amphidinium_carterae.1